MLETPRRWNSSRLLRVHGPFVRQGVYTGHSPDLSDDGSPTFKQNAFTQSTLQRINDNFKGSVPIYIGTHNYSGAHREPVGRSFKIGISDMKDEDSHEGLVWDEDAQRKITEEGYDSVSPEFEISYDPQGNIVDAELTGIVYVKNPAIGGTSNEAIPMCFSQGPSEYVMPDNPSNPAQPPANDPKPPAAPNVPPAQPPAQPPAPPVEPPKAPQQPSAPPVEPPKAPEVHAERKIQYVVDPALVAKVAELESTVKKYEQSIPGIIAQNDAMKTQQLSEIANDLKQFGIEAPESLVDGLPIDSKIKALSQFKERLVKTAPMVKGPDNLKAQIARAEQDKAVFAQALNEIGLTEESYNRVMNGGKIV